MPNGQKAQPPCPSSARQDSDCVVFLQWALPQLGLQWRGFRTVRSQVCKRLTRRLGGLELPDLAAYRAYLLRNPAEWHGLDGLCRIPISRFLRDRGIFATLVNEVLPQLAALAIERGEPALRCWSAGCAGGEEPYTLAIIWEHCIKPRYPQLSLRIVATDADATQLRRAQRGCYARSGLKELPEQWVVQAFEPAEDGFCFCIRPAYRAHVRFFEQDIRTAMPPGPFQLVLCRNLVFTYFDEASQKAALAGIVDRLCNNGVLVVGMHERLPLPAEQVAGKPIHVLPAQRV
jgi:chemotaxis protein methyltransferase CheR